MLSVTGASPHALAVAAEALAAAGEPPPALEAGALAELGELVAVGPQAPMARPSAADRARIRLHPLDCFMLLLLLLGAGAIRPAPTPTATVLRRADRSSTTSQGSTHLAFRAD